MGVWSKLQITAGVGATALDQGLVNLNGLHFTRLKASEALFGFGGAKRCVVARLVLGVHDLATFTFDVPQFHEYSTTVDGLRLIKGEFGVGHWFEGVLEVFPSDAHTISGISGLLDDLPHAGL